jgi:hypothetical protein
MERLFEKEEGTIAHFEFSSVNWPPVYIKRNKELIEQNEKMISLLKKTVTKKKLQENSATAAFSFTFFCLPRE